MTSYPKIAQKKLISLTSWDLQTVFSEDDVTESWLGIGGEDLRKIFGNLRKSSEIFGKSSESVGKARRKKAGRGGWGKARKNEGGVGGVSDDVIEKNKKK